jgi:hypothetical protein
MLLSFDGIEQHLFDRSTRDDLTLKWVLNVRIERGMCIDYATVP